MIHPQPDHGKPLGHERYNWPEIGPVEVQIAQHSGFLCVSIVDWESGEILGHMDAMGEWAPGVAGMVRAELDAQSG